MEAPLHQFSFPPPLPQDALLQQALMMAGSKAPLAAAAAGREQCPRCSSRDTKFCYYNNYNTAQPRHFCRACRRYWTLGGSLRNVPVGGSTRKRQRPPRPTRAMAAAVAAATATPRTEMTAASSGGSSPLAAASPPATLLQGAAGGAGGGGLLVSSALLLGCVSASPSPLLALGAAPLLEGRLRFDLGLGDPALAAAADDDGAAADVMAHRHHLPLALGVGAGPLPWPTTATILEGERAETTTTWKAAAGAGAFPFLPAAALWQELAAAAPVVDAGGLHHAAPHLLL